MYNVKYEIESLSDEPINVSTLIIDEIDLDIDEPKPCQNMEITIVEINNSLLFDVTDVCDSYSQELYNAMFVLTEQKEYIENLLHFTQNSYDFDNINHYFYIQDITVSPNFDMSKFSDQLLHGIKLFQHKLSEDSWFMFLYEKNTLDNGKEQETSIKKELKEAGFAATNKSLDYSGLLGDNKIHLLSYFTMRKVLENNKTTQKTNKN